MAAKFEFEELKDVSSARTLLQQGLRANPESKHLWLEVGLVCIPYLVSVWFSFHSNTNTVLYLLQYFRMELMHTDKVCVHRYTIIVLFVHSSC